MAYLKSTGLNQLQWNSGHIVKSGFLLLYDSAPAITTNTASFQDSGLAGQFITEKTSDETRLEFDFWNMMSHSQTSVIGMSTMTLRASSHSTSHAEGDDLLDHTNVDSYRNYVGMPNQHYQQSTHYHYASNYTYTVIPGNLTGYSAGETLYWRLFHRHSGSNAYYWYHANSAIYLTYREIIK